MKKQYNKALLSFLLAALTLSPALLSACAEKDAPISAGESTAVQSDSETAEELTTRHMPDVPEQNYGGEFLILTEGDNGGDWTTYDVWVEQADADPINDAVYKRNDMVLEHLGVKIQEYRTPNGQNVLSVAQRSIQSNDDEFGAIIAGLNDGLTLAQNGQIYNLYDIPHIDLENEWWDQKCIEESRILGKVYLATGDITVIDNDATWTLMFNKQMITDLNLDVPYDLVRSNTFTFDKFEEMIKIASDDLNGDGKMDWKDDRFGMVTTFNTADGLFFAGGGRFVKLNEELIPSNNIDTEFFSRLVTRAGEIFANKNTVIDDHKTKTISSVADLRGVFEQGRGLFFGEVMQCITRMRDSETDFGVIPWPKLDENQSEYYNMMHYSVSRGVAIPITRADIDMAGAVVEYMAGTSMYTLTPAYYDICLTSKYMRDEESSEMLDIILASRVFDLGYICEWGNMHQSIKSLILDGKTNVASTISSHLKAFEKAMEKTTERFQDNAS